MRVSLFYFQLLLKRIGIALIVFTLCRILFYIFNKQSFPEASLLDFIAGIRFDLSAIGWIFIPYFLLQLLPLESRKQKGYRLTLRILFMISMALCLVFNLIDVNFFAFTLKRTSADIISMIGAGDGKDFLTLLPSFIADYWTTVLLFFVLLWGTYFLYRKTEPEEFPDKHNYLFQFSVLVVGVGFIAILARGGFQLRPLGIINAGQYTRAQNVPLVLNTPFTFIKSLFKDGLSEQYYFETDEIQHIFNPRLLLTARNEFTPRNVVVIIMESFSKEYIGGYNNGKGYTPFLDSLMEHSLVFDQAFANGKRSIEALPAIFSGIPNLMNNPYITSPYSGNKISSIATILGKKGYGSSFFHGGTNGTMGFDAFTSAAGIEAYYGQSEFEGNEGYDGHWGVFDEPFFGFFCNKISEFKEPFFTSVFSLSSHHPYTIPEHLKNKFPKGELQIHESIGYADYSLQRFFTKASKMPWFRNTVFLITADHTAQGSAAYYNNLVGMYAIPMVLYDPQVDSMRINHRITQQADISTILLNYMNYEGQLFVYGEDPMNDRSHSFCINYNNGIYQLICDGHSLQFNGQETVGFYDIRNDSLLNVNLMNDNAQLMLKMERTLKAIIQSYNHRMITNTMHPDG